MNFTTDEDGRKKTFNEINITPLTDIFLVLLIIMMVIAPSFQSANSEITVPEINSGIGIETKNATVAITKDNRFFVNDKLTSSASLETELASLLDNVEKKEVVVRADKETKSSEIMKVMRAAESAGFEKLVVAGEPLTKKQQKELDKNVAEQVEEDDVQQNVNVPSED